MSGVNKFALLALVILATMCTFNEAARCYYYVRIRCYYSGGRYICVRIRLLRCDGRRRGITGEVAKPFPEIFDDYDNDDDNDETPTFETKLFPDKFEKYDVDRDGQITLEELATATNVDSHEKGTVRAFHYADKNNDGKIDCSEFKTAPYLFAEQPTCNGL